jgi:hypothetical protein
MRNRLLTKIGASISLILLGLVGWSAWAWYENQYPSWSEEVKLYDGRVIVVKQKHRYFENHGTVESWVTFSLPEAGGKHTWHSYLKPMRLDVSNGRVYVFGQPRGPKQVQYYRYPKNHLVAFVWKDSEFIRIPFMHVPASLRTAQNVFRCIPTDNGKLLTLEKKSANWCEPEGAWRIQSGNKFR